MQYRKAWDDATVSAAVVPARERLVVSGDARRRAIKSLAHWVPLGNEPSRGQFGENLLAAGSTRLAREMELILATGWFRSYNVGNAYLRYARMKVRQVISRWPRSVLREDVISLFRTGAHFVEPKSYLTVPERLVHIGQGACAGKMDEAIAEGVG